MATLTSDNGFQYEKALGELFRYDIGRSAYFDVQINSPSVLRIYNGESLKYLCHTAELPGETSATVSQKIYGVVEKFPVMSAYRDITLSFYTRGVDIDIVRQNMMSWLTYSTGRQDLVSGHIINSATTYNVPYKNEIVSDITVNHYSVDGSLLTKYMLIDAFPISISETPLSWSQANQAISLNVTFAYTEYKYLPNERVTNLQKKINNAFAPNTDMLSATINNGSVEFSTTFQNSLQANTASYLSGFNFNSGSVNY